MKVIWQGNPITAEQIVLELPKEIEWSHQTVRTFINRLLKKKVIGFEKSGSKDGNCPYSEEPPCLTCNGGSPCKDLAIGLSDLDVQKYELLVKTSSKTIEALEQRGRHEIAEKNKRNLERYQKILSAIHGGKIIFGRIDRIKAGISKCLIIIEKSN